MLVRDIRDMNKRDKYPHSLNLKEQNKIDIFKAVQIINLCLYFYREYLYVDMVRFTEIKKEAFR